MSKYFNILELCHSDTADMNHIDNTPSEEIKEHLGKGVFTPNFEQEWVRFFGSADDEILCRK